MYAWTFEVSFRSWSEYYTVYAPNYDKALEVLNDCVVHAFPRESVSEVTWIDKRYVVSL